MVALPISLQERVGALKFPKGAFFNRTISDGVFEAARKIGYVPLTGGGVYRQVANATRFLEKTLVEFAFYDKSAANPCAKCQQQHVAHGFGGAKFCFRQGCGMGIVQHDHFLAQIRPPLEIFKSLQAPGHKSDVFVRCVGQTRGREANPREWAGRRRFKVLNGCGDGRFPAALAVIAGGVVNLPEYVACLIYQDTFNVGAAEVDADGEHGLYG